MNISLDEDIALNIYSLIEKISHRYLYLLKSLGETFINSHYLIANQGRALIKELRIYI